MSEWVSEWVSERERERECVCVCVCVWMCVCMNVCVWMCVSMNVCLCVCLEERDETMCFRAKSRNILHNLNIHSASYEQWTQWVTTEARIFSIADLPFYNQPTRNLFSINIITCYQFEKKKDSRAYIYIYICVCVCVCLCVSVQEWH